MSWGTFLWWAPKRLTSDAHVTWILKSGETLSSIFGGARPDNPDVPKGDTTKMLETFCDEDVILPEENKSENQDILWCMSVQENTVRSHQKAQALLQGNVFSKTRDIEMKILVGSNGVRKTVTAVLATKAVSNLVEIDCLRRECAGNAVTRKAVCLRFA